jgi:hypothetical protein
MTRLLARVSSSHFVRRDLRLAVIPWALARVLVIGSLWISDFLADKLPQSAHVKAVAHGLFAYDGDWYRQIAEHGYGARESLRFFPLYPLLGRWLGVVFLDNADVALVVIANAAALVFAALVVRLVVHETKDQGIAARAAWYAAIFPAALSFVLPYAEPLMMAAAAGALLALRSRRWWLAAALGVVAGLTRPVGVLLVVPALIEAWRAWRTVTRRELVERMAAVVAPVVGMAIYLGWVGAVYGDAMEPFNVQTRHDLRGRTVDPITHVVDAVGDLFDGDRFGAGLHLVWLAVFIALIVVLARKLPTAYTAYAGASVVLAMTAHNISSFERYVFSTVPIAIAVAFVTKRDEVHRSVSVLAAGGMVAYSVLVFYEAYVP